MFVYRGEVDEPSISIRLRIELVGLGMELAGQRMKLRSGSLPDPRARLIPMLGRLQARVARPILLLVRLMLVLDRMS